MNGAVNPSLNANEMVSSRYSQASGLWDLIDKGAANKAGKQLAKEIVRGLHEGLMKDLKDLNAPLNDIRRSFEDNASKIQKAGKDKFSGEALQLYNKFIRECNVNSNKLLELEVLLGKELNKAVPDTEKILQLEQQRISALEGAEKLNATQSSVLQLIANLERERIVNQEKLNASSAKEKKAKEEELKVIQNNIDNLRKDINAILSEIGDGAEDILVIIEKLLGKMDKGSKTLKESMTSARDSISTLFSSFNTVLDELNIGSKIDHWGMQLDKYTQTAIQMGNAFNTGYGDSSSFNSLKNSIIEEVNNGLYNPEQQMELMKDLTHFSFSDDELAIDMANDIAFAKEYMGQSVESLQSMYALQVRTGQDDFLKKSLNTIASLQRTGNSIGEEQLKAYSESTMTLLDKLINMGMDPAMANEVYSKIMAKADAADKAYGKGMGQQLIDMFGSSLDIEKWGTMLNNPLSTVNSLMTQGDVDSYWNELLKGPSATAATNEFNKADTFGKAVMGSDPDMFAGVNDNITRRFKDESNQSNFDKFYEENLKAISDGKALDNMKNEIEDAAPEYYKNANKIASKLTEWNWGDIGESIAKADFWKNLNEALLKKMDLIIATITIATTAKSLFDKIGGNKLSGSKDGGLISKVASWGGSATTSKVGTWLSGGAGKLAGTKAGSLIGGASLLGGAVAVTDMAVNGFDVGTKGFVNSEGDRIEGTGGFWDGASAAFTDNKIHDSSLANIGGGTLKGAAKGAAIGAAVGTIFPVIGNAAGAAVGGVLGGLGGLISGFWKDSKKADAEAQKERKRQSEIAEKTQNNLESLAKNRDAALATRYSDDRYGVGGPTTEPAPLYPSTPPDESEKPMGGEYRGLDIGKWSVTSDFGSNEDFRKSSHKGIDFAGQPYGTAIGSATDGVVTNVVDGYTWRDSKWDEKKQDYIPCKTNYVDILNESN